MFSRKFSEKGFGIMEVVITSGLVVITAGAIMSMINLSNKALKRSGTVAILQQNKAAIMAHFFNDKSWSATIGDGSTNPILSCFGKQTQGADCRDEETAGNYFTIGTLHFSDTGTFVVDSSQSNFGFDANGHSCKTFNPAAGQGDNVCPFRYELQWKPYGCPQPASYVDADGVSHYVPCPNPSSLLTAKLLVNFKDPAFLGAVNPENYSILTPLDRGPSAGAAGGGGGGGGGGGDDQRQVVQGSCPANSVNVGVNADGSLQCSRLSCKRESGAVDSSSGRSTATCTSGSFFSSGGGACELGGWVTVSEPVPDTNGSIVGWTVGCTGQDPYLNVYTASGSSPNPANGGSRTIAGYTYNAAGNFFVAQDSFVSRTATAYAVCCKYETLNQTLVQNIGN